MEILNGKKLSKETKVDFHLDWRNKISIRQDMLKLKRPLLQNPKNMNANHVWLINWSQSKLVMDVVSLILITILCKMLNLRKKCKHLKNLKKVQL